MRRMIENALKTTIVVVMACALAQCIRMLGIGNESIIMIFLLGVLWTAIVTSSRLWAIVSAVISVMVFNFLYTVPQYTFQIYSTSDIVLLISFMITAVVAGTITSKLQVEMQLAGINEQTANTLYEIATGFLSASGQEHVIEQAIKLVKLHTGMRASVILKDAADLTKTGGQSENAPNTDNLPGEYSVMIEASSGRIGKLVCLVGETGESPNPDHKNKRIIQVIATQLGIALERERLVTEREEIKLAMEGEQQRAMLLRSVAHDLRSPLTALSGAGNLLSDNYQKLTDMERRKLAADVSEESLWLADLVENILNMTRIGEGQLLLQKDYEVIDDVVFEAVKHTERLFRNRSFDVVLPEQVVIAMMDGKLIAQVIVNLLENAVRHTSTESMISLNVAADDSALTLSIADTGEGVPENIENRLFERFITQDSGIVDGRRGLGLGLAICKTIVEAHGGKIWHEKNQPCGSVFIFTLPLEDENV